MTGTTDRDRPGQAGQHRDTLKRDNGTGQPSLYRGCPMSRRMSEIDSTCALCGAHVRPFMAQFTAQSGVPWPQCLACWVKGAPDLLVGVRR